jgi:DNA mismatch repair protein MutS2
VTVEVDDLEPAGGGGERDGDRTRAERSRSLPSSADAGSNAGQLSLARARAVPSSLDLRGARVDEALDALGRYIDDAAVAGLDRVTIIHGLGTGALRDAVREQSSGHPLIREVRPGERGEGGDGATILTL